MSASLLKSIGQFGAGFIPGVGGILSAALGAIPTNPKTKQTQSSTAKEEYNQYNKVEEPEYFSNLRQGIIPYLMGGLRDANNPVFTPAMQSQFLQQQDDSTQQALNSVKNTLARFGRLDSGGASTALGNIEQQNLGAKTQFFSELPFKEKEARQARLLPFLQLGAGWTGAAPVNTRTTGSRTTNTTGTGEISQQGPSWLSSFGQGLGALSGWQNAKTPTSLWDDIKKMGGMKQKTQPIFNNDSWGGPY